MKDWKKIFEEKVSPEHRQNVMKMAEGLLRENEIRNPSRRKLWFWTMSIGSVGFASAMSFLFIIKPRLDNPGIEGEELAAANFDDELVDDGELLAELELLEDLEVLEQWNDG